MFARVARYQIPEENLDDAVEGFREAIEELRELQGNSGGYLLVDRDNSTALTVTFWENRAALESSDMQASRLRSQAVTPHGARSRRSTAARSRSTSPSSPERKGLRKRFAPDGSAANPPGLTQSSARSPRVLNPFEG